MKIVFLFGAVLFFLIGCGVLRDKKYFQKSSLAAMLLASWGSTVVFLWGLFYV